MNVRNGMYSSIYLCKHIKTFFLNIPALKQVIKNRASQSSKITINRIKPINTITIVHERKRHCDLRGLDDIPEITSLNLNLQVTKCCMLNLALSNNVQQFQLTKLDYGSISLHFTTIPTHLKHLELRCSFSELTFMGRPPLPRFYIEYMGSCSMDADPLKNIPLAFKELNLHLPLLRLPLRYPPLLPLPPSLRVLKLQVSPQLNLFTFGPFPPTLEHLELYGDFTTGLSSLPPALKTLKYGPTDPCPLTELKWLMSTVSLDSDLPPTLQTWDGETTLPMPLLNLPMGLECLDVRLQEAAELHIPDSVKRLSIGTDEESDETFEPHLPPNLRALDMWGFWHNSNRCSFDNLPARLSELVLPPLFNLPIGQLPATLRKIQFGWEFNQPLLFLPEHLQELVFKGTERPIKFDQPLDRLPVELREIRFIGTSLYNQCFGPLPTQLEVLQLVHVDEQTLAKLEFERLLPRYELHPIITHTTVSQFHRLRKKNGMKVEPKPMKYRTIVGPFQSKYNQPFESLPSSLRFLTLGESYLHSFDFPSGVTVVVSVMKSVATPRLLYSDRKRLKRSMTCWLYRACGC